MPATGGLGNAIRKGKAMGCTAVQVFTSSPQQWRAREITEEMVQDFQSARKETEMAIVISHDSYLINLCAPDLEMREKSLQGILAEMRRCAQYGIPWTVSHVGAHMGQGEAEGLKIAAQSLTRVFEEAPDGIGVLVETTAGQGSSLNYRFEQIAELLQRVGSDRLAVCIDTCHLFASGYDLRSEDAYQSTMSLFDKIVGCNKLVAIHCNDSKKALGSRVDRHEEIGRGELGELPFRLLVNDPRFYDIPIIVETPEAETMHEINVQRLWSYVES